MELNHNLICDKVISCLGIDFYEDGKLFTVGALHHHVFASCMVMGTGIVIPVTNLGSTRYMTGFHNVFNNDTHDKCFGT